VVPDPEPNDLFAIKQSKGAASEDNPNGEDRFTLMHLLELEAWMPRVLAKQSISAPGPLPDIVGQRPICHPEPLAFLATSQFAVDVSRGPGSHMHARLSGQLRKAVLRRRKLRCPLLFVRQLVKQPQPNAILVSCWQLRQLG